MNENPNQPSFDDILPTVQEDTGLTAKDARKAAEGGSGTPLPIGDYKMLCVDVKPREWKSTTKGVPNGWIASYEYHVIEPETHRERKFFYDVKLFSPGEPDFFRNKRIGFLVALGVVKKDDLSSEDPNVREAALAKLRKFDPRMFVNQVHVVEVGQVYQWSKKHEEMRTYNEPRNFIGIWPESRWQETDKIQLPPIKGAKPRKGKTGPTDGSGGGAAVKDESPEDIVIETDEEC